MTLQQKHKLGGRDFNDFGLWFKGFIPLHQSLEISEKETKQEFSKRCYAKLIDNLLEECADNNGNGRGVIGITADPIFGDARHVFSWEAKNGKLFFYDPQQNILDASTLLSHPKINPSTFEYARLDNLELKDAISQICKNIKR